MKTFTVTEATTLKNFTDITYPQGSFYLSALFRRGDVSVNGVRKKSDCPVRSGDIITYYTTPAQEGKPSHIKIFEDENIYVADKFSGVCSEALFCELSTIAPYPVHRLDRNTQGLILLAKSEGAQAQLIKAFRERLIKKEYLCLAKNCFKKSEGELSAYLSKDEVAGTVKIFPESARGRVKIETGYEVISTFGDYALVKVILHSGKTHQIRAHLAYIGCPVLGDTRYGDFALNKKYGLTRQALVAKTLSFNLEGELAYLNERTFTSNFSPTIRR